MVAEYRICLRSRIVVEGVASLPFKAGRNLEPSRVMVYKLGGVLMEKKAEKVRTIDMLRRKRELSSDTMDVLRIMAASMECKVQARVRGDVAHGD